jgi:hypothetical protein
MRWVALALTLAACRLHFDELGDAGPVGAFSMPQPRCGRGGPMALRRRAHGVFASNRAGSFDLYIATR